MARKKLTNSVLYRRRVLLAYIFIFAALAILLWLGLTIPGGLTGAERESSVKSLNAGIIGVNAPYYLLQKASLNLFGLSVVSVKLPSILLGAILGVCLFFLLRRWVTLGIATFSSLIMFSSTTFLNLVGTGSPDILYVLYPTLILFFGTRVLAHDGRLILFAILLLVTIALALLTPTMAYLIILALCLAALNPHVRYGFRRLPASGLLALGLGFIIAVAPVAYLAVTDPGSLRTILALPSSLDIAGNVTTVLTLLGSFLNPGIVEDRPAPLVGLATIGLTLIGLYGVFKAIYTARAQFIIGWSVIAIVLAVIDPGLGILLYLPIVLLAALGLSGLAGIWYRTFPLNPYARVSALVPISILIGGIVIGSTLRYVNTSHYADGSQVYSRDLSLITSYAAEKKAGTLVLAVSERDMDFYDALNTRSVLGTSKTTYTVISPDAATSTNGPIVSVRALPELGIPTRIITDGRSDAADRFYVYR